ncbi:cation:proton antiporter subunit C [Clostridium sp. D2Q-14]|uniref:sodium:proton antiporter n=1 Tax=Anaeromonas gelatinilytica TaxID=2683194 RepID=UPI00193C6B89|nr:cation:proton antiporter subunit C [Anaeromonas gelatinilytica]MBS4536487.1 cation:proton antiporter subunit C [Anaeromonas gelatinilytica]
MRIDILLSFIVVLIGIYGLCTSKNIIKSVISLNITDAAIVLLFLSIGSSEGGDPPILNGTISSIVDPIPQALMITAIVIGAAITAMALMLSIKLFHYYGSLNWKDIMEKEG